MGAAFTGDNDICENPLIAYCKYRYQSN